VQQEHRTREVEEQGVARPRALDKPPNMRKDVLPGRPHAAVAVLIIPEDPDLSEAKILD
jgi:hypothetical protein